MVALSTLATLLLTAAPLAQAHQGNPEFRSVVTGIRPNAAGLQVRVLGFDDRLELTNRSGKTVVISGYEGEPYARILADGTVLSESIPLVPRRPRAWLCHICATSGPVASLPSGARSGAYPEWKTLDRVGTFQWHDHRAHWMGRGLPPTVKDQSRKTRVFNYRIPISTSGRPGRITGTLYWVGSESGGVPMAAIAAMGVVLLAALTLVLVVRRRRKAR